MARPFVFIAAIAVAFVCSYSLVTSADDTASDLFRRRVLPIL